jgi:hypothetical protein
MNPIAHALKGSLQIAEQWRPLRYSKHLEGNGDGIWWSTVLFCFHYVHFCISRPLWTSNPNKIKLWQDLGK